MTAFVKHQRATDEQMLEYVKAGVLRVDPDGSVWRCKKRQVGIRYAKWMDCTPRRCDNLRSYIIKVPLCQNSIQLAISTPRLVWRVLRGPIPAHCRVVHIDGNRRNNHPDNLKLQRMLSSIGIDELWSACRSPREELILHALIEHGSYMEAARSLGVRLGRIAETLRTMRRRVTESHA